MNMVTNILVVLVALEFFYIMYLETFATTSKKTSRVFHMSEQELKRDSVTTLFKNQGIYNGLIGVGLLYAVFFSGNPKELTLLLLSYIILVALYGSFTSNKKIILMQGGIAILAMLSFLF